MANPPPLNPNDAFRDKLEDLERRVGELTSRPVSIPVLNAAPDASYAGNIWAYPDGRLVVRLKDGSLKQFTSATAGAPSGTNPTPPPQPITRVSSWTATWGQAYRQTGAKTGGDDKFLYYGNSGESSFNGRQKSLIGFDYASIAATLSGSQIAGARIFLYNVHTWAYSGATCYVGMHNNTAAPGTFGGTVRDNISSFHTDRNRGAWHSVSTEFGSRLRDGSAKGIILEAPSDSTQYYGYAAGFGAGLSLPVIEITYIK